MLSCKEVTRLVSDSMDNSKLTIWQRMQVRLHLLMCSLCSRFRKQAEFLRLAARKHTSANEDSAKGPNLSEDARERIKKVLRSGS